MSAKELVEFVARSLVDDPGWEARRLALRPGDERLAKPILPMLELAPDVAVRGAERLGRMADRAVLLDGLQQLEQRVEDVRAALAAAVEAVLQVDATPVHGRD